MISMLQGHRAKTPDDNGNVVILCAGVGYGVTFSDRDRDAVNVKDEVTVFVRHVLGESSSTLYGFFAADDRTAFDRICKLDGIGPVTAMRVLSKMSFDEFKALIASGNVAELTKIPGIGDKGAAKLLKAKLEPKTVKIAALKPKKT